jgi:hypothetical protein
MLTLTEAQRVAQRFLQAKYFRSRINFEASQLLVWEDRSVYKLQGKITMRSLGLLDRFILDKSANTYNFTIEVEAQRGHIVSYRLT